MFDILKDSNGRFNKKNILPLIGAAIGSTVGLSSVASLIYVASTDPSLTANPNMGISSYADSLVAHIFLIIFFIAISSLYLCYSIDNIIENKRIEDRKANSEPRSRIRNALVSDVLEEQSVV